MGKLLVLLLKKARTGEEPAGLQPIPQPIPWSHSHSAYPVSSSASRWISVKLMLPSIEYRWHTAIKRSNPELFSLRVAGIALRLGVYDKRVRGFEHCPLDGNSGFVSD
jgi:hypothetical protein